MECRVVKVGSSLYLHVAASSVKAHQIEEGDVWDIPSDKIRLVARGVALPSPNRRKEPKPKESNDGGSPNLNCYTKSA